MEEILLGFGIFMGGMFILFVVNYFVQLFRTKKYVEEGYLSVMDKGFQIKKNVEDGTYEIISDEKPSILF